MSNLQLASMHVKKLEAAYLAKPAANSLPLGYATDFSVNLTTMQRRVYAIRHHGHEIASVADYQVTIRNAGYNSRTTADRLNRILRDNDIPFHVATRQGLHVILGKDLKVIRHLSPSATFTMVAGVWTLDYFA